MSKIIGNPVGTTLPKPDWTQTDPTKGDYIKNKPDFDGLESRVDVISERVGDTPVADQIGSAVSGKADKTYVDSQDTTTLNNAKSYTDTKIANLLDNDTAAVDSIMELADAMKDNADAIEALTTIAGNKVDKVDGKGLSTNDYTTEEKEKLAGIAAGAEVNVQSDWNATSGDALILNKPTIPSKTSQLTNDSGYLTAHQDISGKADKTYVDTKFTNLVGDTAVPTQISNAIAGKADKTYVDTQDAATLTTAKTYTNEQVAGKVDKVTGKGLSTNDYTTEEKNKLAGIAAGAEVNVQSDWNATSGDAMILNKPTIPSKTSQLTNDSGYLTSHQDISGKADKSYVDSQDTTTLNSAKSYTDTKFTNLVGDTAVPTQISNAISGKADKTDITSHTGNKSNPHEVTLTQLGVTATAAELNYVDGVTSNIQTQLNDKAAKSYVDTQDTATLNSAKSYTDTKVAAFVDSAPETLDTLNELAAALGDDPNFATTVANQISTKADKSYTDNQDMATLNSAKSYVDTAVGAVSSLVGDTTVAVQINTALDGYATKEYVDGLMTVDTTQGV